MCVYVCICVCLCLCVCLFVCFYILYVCVSLYIYICVCVCVCVCVCIYIYTHTRRHTHTNIYTHINTHTYIHTHIHTHRHKSNCYMKKINLFIKVPLNWVQFFVICHLIGSPGCSHLVAKGTAYFSSTLFVYCCFFKLIYLHNKLIYRKIIISLLAPFKYSYRTAISRFYFYFIKQLFIRINCYM